MIACSKRSSLAISGNLSKASSRRGRTLLSAGRCRALAVEVSRGSCGATTWSPAGTIRPKPGFHLSRQGLKWRRGAGVVGPQYLTRNIRACRVRPDKRHLTSPQGGRLSESAYNCSSRPLTPQDHEGESRSDPSTTDRGASLLVSHPYGRVTMPHRWVPRTSTRRSRVQNRREARQGPLLLRQLRLVRHARRRF